MQFLPNDSRYEIRQVEGIFDSLPYMNTFYNESLEMIIPTVIIGTRSPEMADSLKLIYPLKLLNLS